jgi:hypothetical protein
MGCWELSGFRLPGFAQLMIAKLVGLGAIIVLPALAPAGRLSMENESLGHVDASSAASSGRRMVVEV